MSQNHGAESRQHLPGNHQRRVVLSLSLAQLFSGLGNGSGLALGSLMAVDLTGSNAYAGATTMAISVAGALTALPLAGLAIRRGRRVALSAGMLIAAVGALGMMLTPILESFPLLLFSAGLLGVGNAANLQARFAATDLAEPATRGRDLGLVVWAITLGAVTGPNLIGPGAAMGRSLGLPDESGPFIFSVAGLLVAVLILNVGLRPDPLRMAGEPGAPAPVRLSLGGGLTVLRHNPAARLGVITIVVSHLVMVAVMSMTPVHFKDLDAIAAGASGGALAGHHASLDVLVLIGFTISLHIAGMYALSPFIGILADKWGRRQTMLASQVVLAASLLCCAVGSGSQQAVTVGLILLGLGWSLATVAGSAFVSERVDVGHRLPVQGLSDALMGAAGAIGAAGSGILLAFWGFDGLSLTCLVFVLLVGIGGALELRRHRRAILEVGYDDVVSG